MPKFHDALDSFWFPIERKGNLVDIREILLMLVSLGGQIKIGKGREVSNQAIALSLRITHM